MAHASALLTYICVIIQTLGWKRDVLVLCSWSLRLEAFPYLVVATSLFRRPHALCGVTTLTLACGCLCTSVVCPPASPRRHSSTRSGGKRQDSTLPYEEKTSWHDSDVLPVSTKFRAVVLLRSLQARKLESLILLENHITVPACLCFCCVARSVESSQRVCVREISAHCNIFSDFSFCLFKEPASGFNSRRQQEQ